MSSTFVLIIQPLTMTSTLHGILTTLQLNFQPVDEYRKYIGRSFYLRQLSENVSMLAFLGWICVIHFGPNQKIYPYLSFRDADTKNDGYTFELTFWASSITWICEIVADWMVRRILWWCFEFGVTGEAKRDFVDFPLLLPCCL